MSVVRARRHRQQAGFTLIELLVASTIGLILLTGLASVVFTTNSADQAATSRVEASSEIRSFQEVAYNDFALSVPPPTPAGCGSSAQPCTQDPIQLHGCVVTDPTKLTLQNFAVSYTWNSGTHHIDRFVGGSQVNSPATDVTAFDWYVDGGAPNQTVVVELTVTLGDYSQRQTMRFYPRIAATLPNFVDAPC